MLHIVFQSHRADVTEPLQQRAEQAVRKLAARLRGATDASIRFAEDGAMRRVELALSVARRAPLVAAGAGPRYEVALSSAVERLSAHVAHLRAERERNRRVAGVPRAPLGAAVREDDTEEGDLAEDASLDAAAARPLPAAEA